MKKRSILLVDDEPGFRFSAGIALRKAGYKVNEAEDGQDALRQVLEMLDGGSPYDLVVTDIRMPGMSGIELMEELRVSRIPVPVLAMTGFSDKELVHELRSKGCKEYIEKPFPPHELVGRIIGILTKHEESLRNGAKIVAQPT